MTCFWIYWNLTKIFLARKWNSVEDRPVTDRSRGFIVTKMKILKVVSFSGAAPSFLGPRNHCQGLGLQKGRWENPVRRGSNGGPARWSGRWAPLSPTRLLVSGSWYFMEPVFLLGGGGNLVNLGRKCRLGFKNLIFGRLSEKTCFHILGSALALANQREYTVVWVHAVKLCIPNQLLFGLTSVMQLLSWRSLFRACMTELCWILTRETVFFTCFILGGGHLFCSVWEQGWHQDLRNVSSLVS